MPPKQHQQHDAAHPRAWLRLRPRLRARPPRSLRLRLALWYGGLLAVALLLFGALVTVLTSNAILGSVDTSLGAEARIATLDLDRELSPDSPYWPATLNLNVVDAYRDPGVTVAIYDAQGRVRYRSATGAALPVGTTSLAFAAALTGQTSVITARASGEPVRVVVVPVLAPATTLASPAPSGGEATATATANHPSLREVIGVLLVAKSLRDVDSTLLLLRTMLILTGLAILAAALFGGWVIALRVLRPLALIGTTARRIASGTSGGSTAAPLRQRVPRPPGEDELAHLVDTLNDMLAALEQATGAQRRFVADASHELRAPLTIIQGNLAFLEHHADDLPPAERQTMVADALGETLRLARLVDDLLLLARADASSDERAAGEDEGAQRTPRDAEIAEGEGEGEGGAAEVAEGTEMSRGARGAHPQPAGELIELDRVVLHLVRQLRARLAADESRLRLEVGHVEPVRVYGDEETLRRVALILLDNAMKYTRAAGEVAAGVGRVTVLIERAGDEVALRVRDTGIGIAAADLPHIFERFYRADTARSRQGTGLGLAIAQTLVERLGGRITVESEPGHGSTFTVWLPSADPKPAPTEP